MAGVPFRDRMRSLVIQEGIRVKLHCKEAVLDTSVFRGMSHWEEVSGRQTTSWRDYISWMAWKTTRCPPEEHETLVSVSQIIARKKMDEKPRRNVWNISISIDPKHNASSDTSLLRIMSCESTETERWLKLIHRWYTYELAMQAITEAKNPPCVCWNTLSQHFGTRQTNQHWCCN